MTVERPRTRGAVGAASVVAYAGAAALAMAAGWYALAVKGVTVATSPRFPATLPLQQKLALFFNWVVTTLPQERLYTSIAIGGMTCLMAVSLFARDMLGRERPVVDIHMAVPDQGPHQVGVHGQVAQRGAPGRRRRYRTSVHRHVVRRPQKHDGTGSRPAQSRVHMRRGRPRVPQRCMRYHISRPGRGRLRPAADRREQPVHERGEFAAAGRIEPPGHGGRADLVLRRPRRPAVALRHRASDHAR